MKKKITLVLALILLLTFAVGSLSACDDIFKKNVDRDSNQIIASVSYAGMSTNIKKHELISSFNSYGYYYVNYYGMSYQQAFDYLAKSLGQRELLVLFAKEYIAKDLGVDPRLVDYYSSVADAKNLLSSSEYNKAIENTNNNLLDSLINSIEELIIEDKYNDADDTVKPDVEEDVEITESVRVKFESNDAIVSEDKVQNNTLVDEPAQPTKAGSVFYGWFETKDCMGDEWDFEEDKIVIEDYENTRIKSKTLYAKWIETTAPRPVAPSVDEESEEDADEDYDPDDNTARDFEAKFFTDEYRATIDLTEEDFIEDIQLEGDETLEIKLNQYITEGIAKLISNMEKLYTSYEIFLEAELKTLVLTKLERMISDSVTTTKEDVQIQFDRVVLQNKEVFENSSTSYQTAITSALATTYYHTFIGDDSFGYVVNILLKLDQDSVDELIVHVKNGTMPENEIIAMRDRMISEMTVKVSNPDYDPEFEEDYGQNGEEDIEIRDPMTDPENPYNGEGEKDNKYNADNDYNNIISFEIEKDENGLEIENGKWEIVYNVKESPAMPYLINEVPAYTNSSYTGIIEQIYTSFEQITKAVENGKLKHIESIYWLREMATSWLYLVSDDGGGTSAENNNGGLGYLVTPEGEKSSFLPAFTDHARDLIKNGGTGAYTTAAVDALRQEKIDNSFVIADSFIEEGKTDGGYAGVFILLVSHKVWDDKAYGATYNDDDEIIGEELLVLNKNTKTLPMNYIITYGETLEDCVTIGMQIYDKVDIGKKKDKYNVIVNKFGSEFGDNVSIFSDVYEQLWKDLED